MLHIYVCHSKDLCQFMLFFPFLQLFLVWDKKEDYKG